MKAISNMKDGNFYFIKTLEIVNECFIDALGGLFSIIGNNNNNFYYFESLECQA